MPTISGTLSVTLIKNTLCHKCFPANFPKILRTPFRPILNSCRYRIKYTANVYSIPTFIDLIFQFALLKNSSAQT